MPTATKSDRYVEGIGRRKQASARVRITPAAKNVFKINEKSLEDYFNSLQLNQLVNAPLKAADLHKFNISVHVKGGGPRGQAEALALGLARAITKYDDNLRKPIKKAGLLTRDSRIKERKKFGRKKARKSPQWSKR